VARGGSSERKSRIRRERGESGRTAGTREGACYDRRECPGGGAKCRVLPRARKVSLEVVINAGLGHGQRNVFSRCCRGWLVRKKASGRAFALTINNRVRGYVQV
jgi:hypothetical protein